MGKWYQPKIKKQQGYVYVLLFPDYSTYVGYTKNTVEKRWANGKGYYWQPQMRDAIERYGWERIRRFYCNIPDEKLGWFAESLLIALLNSQRDGYNISCGHYMKSINRTSATNFFNKFPDVKQMYNNIMLTKELHM